jgi:hypothetical protein
MSSKRYFKLDFSLAGIASSLVISFATGYELKTGAACMVAI